MSGRTSKEELRLDWLRLAMERQGARDCRGLLEIAEEYFGWVTAGGEGVEGGNVEELRDDKDERPDTKAVTEENVLTQESLQIEPIQLGEHFKRSGRNRRRKKRGGRPALS